MRGCAAPGALSDIDLLDVFRVVALYISFILQERARTIIGPRPRRASVRRGRVYEYKFIIIKYNDL